MQLRQPRRLAQALQGRHPADVCAALTRSGSAGGGASGDLHRSAGSGNCRRGRLRAANRGIEDLTLFFQSPPSLLSSPSSSFTLAAPRGPLRRRGARRILSPCPHRARAAEISPPGVRRGQSGAPTLRWRRHHTQHVMARSDSNYFPRHPHVVRPSRQRGRLRMPRAPPPAAVSQGIHFTSPSASTASRCLWVAATPTAQRSPSRPDRIRTAVWVPTPTKPALREIYRASAKRF